MNNLRLFPRHPGFRRSSSSDEDSPTRRPAHSSNNPPPHSVKRALFGPTDHEENLRFASQELKRHRDEAASRWNFNFETGQPLKGRYAWKEEAVLLAGDGHPVVPTAGGILVRRMSRPLADSPSDPADNRENMAVVGGALPLGLSCTTSSSAISSVNSALLPPHSGGAGSMRSLASATSSLLAGPPAGCLEDLRTPAPLPSAAVASSSGFSSLGGAERTGIESSPAAARLSETTAREQQGGARPKTKEQKITDAFKSRKHRSKSSSRLRSIKRLDGPRPVASRSPSVKSRGGGGAHRSPPAAFGGRGATAASEAAAATDHCNSD